MSEFLQLKLTCCVHLGQLADLIGQSLNLLIACSHALLLSCQSEVLIATINELLTEGVINWNIYTR